MHLDSSKDRSHRLCSSLIISSISITHSLGSLTQQSPYHTTQREGAVPLQDPKGWHDRAPKVHSKELGPISTDKTGLLWLCIQQQPQLLQTKVNLSCKCNMSAPQTCRSQLTALLDTQNPSLELLTKASWQCVTSKKSVVDDCQHGR